MNREVTMEMLDATGLPWTRTFTPGRKKQYMVSITRDRRGITGESTTFEEAAEIAMRLAGLLKITPLPKVRRTIDINSPVVHLAWNNALAEGRR